MSAAVGAIAPARRSAVDAIVGFARRNTWTVALLGLLAGVLVFTRLIQSNYGAPQIQGLAISVLPIALAAVAQGIVVISGGIDIGTKRQIYSLLRDLAAAGAAVLLYTSELKEIQLACDRTIVIFGGRVVAEIPVADADEPALLRAAYDLPPDAPMPEDLAAAVVAGDAAPSAAGATGGAGETLGART